MSKLVRSILYVQYNDPAAYPPLGHSSLLLAERGWRVRHLGAAVRGGATGMALPEHPSIDADLMPAPAGGWRTAMHYARFLAWCRAEIIRQRPDVVYCSDLRSYPIGLWASRRVGTTTVLHEHDPPGIYNGLGGMRVMSEFRRIFAQCASIIVIPQDERARAFLKETGVAAEKVHVVYNCPMTDTSVNPEVRRDGAKRDFVLWYHGSFGYAHVPSAMIEALELLPNDVRLEMAGYETQGSRGFVQDVRQRAERLGVESRIVVHDAMPRTKLLSLAAKADVGLALFASDYHMPLVGASNKPFDYLACGLPLLTNPTFEWTNFFGSEGVALNCDPNNPRDIARAVLALRDDPERRAKMAEAGLRLIRTKWNYEAQFSSVLSAFSVEGANSIINNQSSAGAP